MEEHRRRKRILIVDDEEAFARLVQGTLESVGYEVRAALDGKAALSYAAEQPVDLAILDINLPDLNGFEVGRELRKLHLPWELPIVMLTVRDTPVDQLRGFAHGADAYLTKPFNTAELRRTVALLIGEAALA